jgi:hypothetical protein
MRRWAIYKHGAHAKQLLELLHDYYRRADVTKEIKKLKREQLVCLVEGLTRDFVPAMRRPRHQHHRKKEEWIFDDPPDLRDASRLAQLLHKHRNKRGTEGDLFKYLINHHRSELPARFQRRSTGVSLKQAYFDILGQYKSLKRFVHSGQFEVDQHIAALAKVILKMR